MVNRMQFYIDGAWVDPSVKKSTPVVNPATEEAMYEVALGSKADVDKAVAAAKRAFVTFSQTSREDRIALLEKIIEIYKGRMKEIGAAVSDEMGAPLPMAERLQAGAGLGHIASTLEVLKNYHFEENVGTAVVVREPVGVIGMITPWNWPLNQIACKVAPALAAGCTMILKPSEFTPSSALIFAEILHEAEFHHSLLLFGPLPPSSRVISRRTILFATSAAPTWYVPASIWALISLSFCARRRCSSAEVTTAGASLTGGLPLFAFLVELIEVPSLPCSGTGINLPAQKLNSRVAMATPKRNTTRNPPVKEQS